MFDKKNNIPVENVYKGLEDNIRFLKTQLIINFKTLMKERGFRFVAEWVDYNLPILYNDIYLVEYNNYLFDVSFSAGMKKITIGDSTFNRFDTIISNKLTCKRKSMMGYKIGKDNKIERIPNTSHTNYNKYLVYKDLLRIDKISKLLKEDEFSKEDKD